MTSAARCLITVPRYTRFPPSPVRRFTGQTRHGGDASALCSILFNCLLGGSIRVRRGVGVDRRTGKTQILNRLFGGSPKAPWGPGSKMGATTRLRKSHLATACSAAHRSGPAWRRRKRSLFHYSQLPARRLNPGPTRSWGRPANQQNPKPQPPVRRLTQGPVGPLDEDGCNHAAAKIPSCDCLCGEWPVPPFLRWCKCR
jgi:hypothetical protein